MMLSVKKSAKKKKRKSHLIIPGCSLGPAALAQGKKMMEKYTKKRRRLPTQEVEPTEQNSTVAKDGTPPIEED